MDKELIPIDLCDFSAFSLWDGWFLLTAGDFGLGHFNTMTVSWGMMGVMWNKSVVQVMVQPSRRTYELIEKYPDFTLSAFPENHHRTLSMLGVKSGHEIDKVKEAGLTAVASKKVAAPTFAEAELVLECRKIYYGDILESHFLVDGLAGLSSNDFHRFYLGEILAVEGVEKFSKR